VSFSLDCDASLLGQFSLPTAADYMAIRRASDMGGDEETETWGTACSGASDMTLCQTTLATTWPSSTGWGYCGEGCSDYGLVWTRNDEVGLADAKDELVGFFGDIDTPAEALFLVQAAGYTPVCSTLVSKADGSYEFEANILISDCPWTTEDHMLSVDSRGAVVSKETLAVNEDGSCAGRRPDGLLDATCVPADSIARHIAGLARLEAAAVVAFERLALDLERFGAPADLVRRARRAARDEVKHAHMMGVLASQRGFVPDPIEVAPYQQRDFAEFARENAVEGCVRETFGVADALYRSKQAPTAGLRSAFKRIARDEARHAELSWDIDRWARQQMSETQQATVEQQMVAAYEELASQLSTERPDEVQRALGAPSAQHATSMASKLRERLAA